MPVLKFWLSNNNLTLEGLRMEDITSDQRTKLINQQSFLQKRYQVDKNNFLAINDMFFRLARIFNKSKEKINAMLIKEKNYNIIIIPSNSYVFWNGKSIHPEKYELNLSFGAIKEMLGLKT